mgnify:CR=1 FL=1
MTAEERILEAGYEDVVIFSDYSYDDALIGVTTDNRAVYDYDKMVQHLIEHDKMTYDDAVDFINYNTVRACPYAGEQAPIILRSIDE